MTKLYQDIRGCGQAHNIKYRCTNQSLAWWEVSLCLWGFRRAQIPFGKAFTEASYGSLSAK